MLGPVCPAGPRFEASIAAFDARNAADPSEVEIDAQKTPRELARARRLSHWVTALDPDASVALRLAARCQHLMRWTVPRSSFPEGRSGYHRWRRHLATVHADLATEILTDLGWDEATIAEVRRINLKREMKTHADVQTMEDALCLSFIENELAEFADGKSEEKLASILRDTWRKMSPHGRSFAPGLLGSLPAALRATVERALATA